MLFEPDELSALTDGRRLSPDRLQSAMYASRFHHGDEAEKHEVIGQSFARSTLDEYVQIDYMRYMLANERIDWLLEFHYVSDRNAAMRDVYPEENIPTRFAIIPPYEDRMERTGYEVVDESGEIVIRRR